MNKARSINAGRIALICALSAVLLLSGLIRVAPAEEVDVDLTALTTETQKFSKQVDEMTMLWWIPEEFWRVSFSQDASITPEQTEEFIEVLQPYTIVVVVDGKLGSFGGITYTSEKDLKATIVLKDSEGTRYSPLPEEAINADTQNFLAMMKPVFANMLGPMGENMHFFLFPAKNKTGQRIIEAKKEGAFWIGLGKREFKWRLPLSSLLPTKTCPVCKESLSGAYKFCPYDGTKLQKTEPEAF